MLKIAIVDDNELDTARLKKGITNYFSDKQIPYQIDVFNRAITFLDQYKCDYDAILLDINMPVMNGMEAAYKIRELSPSVSLIFETNYSSLAIDGYGVGALGFLVKPVRAEDIKEVFDKLLVKLDKEKDDNKIIIKVKSGFQTLNVSEIKFVEVVIHDIYYHTVNGVFESRGVLKNIEASFNNPKFVKCSNCYLVNLDYVESIIKDDVKIDGMLLKISRNKKKHFVEAYLRNFE